MEFAQRDAAPRRSPARSDRPAAGSAADRRAAAVLLALHPPGALAGRRAVHLRRPDRHAGRDHPGLHRPRRRAGLDPRARRPAARDLAAASHHGRRAAAGAAAGVHGPRGADQPDRQPRPVQHGPLAEPLARGAAELDVLPERLRRTHRQPGAADRPVAPREPGDGVRRRLVHHRVRQQRAGAARLGRLAPDAADPAVVLRLRRHPGLLRAAPARTLARGVRDALQCSPAAWWTATPTS